MNELPAKNKPIANLIGKLGSKRPNLLHSQEMIGANATMKNGLIDWNHVTGNTLSQPNKLKARSAFSSAYTARTLAPCS